MNIQLLHEDILKKDKDFVANCFRRESKYLQSVLMSVENEDKIDVMHIPDL